MFKKGDLLMYGSIGVCEVTGIETPDFEKSGKLYYCLRPRYQSGMIYAPIDNEKVFIRPVLSSAEVNSLIDAIPEIETTIYKCSSIQQLSKMYQSILDSHDTESMLAMTKSIHAKEKNAIKNNRKLGHIDKKFLKRAQDIVYGEFAAVLGLERDDIENYIRTRLTKAR